MEDYYQSLNTFDWQSIVIFIIDKILYIMYSIAVCYLCLFSLASLLNKKKRYSAAKKQHRFAVYFFNNSTGGVIIESVKSFLDQDYPKDKFDIIAVSSEQNSEINTSLKELPIKLITTGDSNHYSKAKDIQYAIANTPDNMYDVAVILDANNTVETNYLAEINDAYYSGSMAIQTHRISKDLHTDTALFGAISEEINNSIFRLGHANLGFSSALLGSGTALNFSWLKMNLAQVTLVDAVKQLEIMLLEQSIFIEYLNYVNVYGDKANKVGDFNKLHNSWYESPLIQANNILYKFPKYLIQGNYDYCDKLFQWLLPSRMILFGTLVMITIAILILSWALSIKWLLLFLFLITAFSISTPDYFIDARFIKAMRSAPIIVTITIINAIKRRIKPTKKQVSEEQA